jgi:hypothetical protein
VFEFVLIVSPPDYNRGERQLKRAQALRAAFWFDEAARGLAKVWEIGAPEKAKLFGVKVGSGKNLFQKVFPRKRVTPTEKGFSPQQQ